jgi:hypothetical protein
LECLVEKSHIEHTEDNKDSWIECNICGYRANELANHLKRAHAIKAKDYGLTKCKNFRDKMKGENNPAYQHGGKLSPFSKNFINFESEDKISELKVKARATRESNCNYSPFDRAYYNSDEEYTKAQTRDLAWFIEKFGEIEGIVKHKEKTEKWITALDAKSEDEKKRINRLKVGNGYAISEAERELIEICIKNNINVISQLQLKKDNKGYYLYDISYNSKIIEYNGDFWHCNPTIWDSEKYNPRLHMNAKEKWKLDKIKNEFAESQGYDVLVIWESDYKNDTQGTIDRCIKFLTQ